MATAKKAPAKKATATPKAAPATKETVATKKKAPAKKTAIAKKAAAPVKANEPAWNTIHVFGYGESQVTGREVNGKVVNSELKMITPLYAALAKKQQKGTKVSLEGTHALSIFNGMFVDLRMRGGEGSQRWAWADIDAKAVEKLADELMSKAPKESMSVSRLFGGVQGIRNGVGAHARKAVAGKKLEPTKSGNSKKATAAKLK